MAPTSGCAEVSAEALRELEAFQARHGLCSVEEALRMLLRSCGGVLVMPGIGSSAFRLPNIHFLPFDVLAFVLSYVDCTNLRACATVCKAWCRVIRGDPVLKPLAQEGWMGLYIVGGIRPAEGRTAVLCSLSEVCRLNPISASWGAAPPMRDERYHCGAVGLNRQLYVLGGRNNKTRLNTMERYDVLSRTWTALPPMKTVRSAPAVAAFRGSIYVFGGYDGRVEHRTIERFDPETGLWCTATGGHTGMPVEACEVSAVVLGPYIYIIGGTQSRYSQQENILAVCQRYDPGADQWSVLSPMKHKRMCPAAVALHGKIYVIGGSSGVASLDVVEVYDPRTDTWQSSPPMNICRSNATACVFQGEIFVAGGFCSGALDTVEKFNPDTGLWSLVAKMPSARDACKLIAFE
eukprot:RCo015914